MTARDNLELVFKHSGGVEVRASTASAQHDVVVWASDSDQDFTDEFGAEIMSGDEDAEDVLDYLTEHDVLSDEEAELIDIFDESLDGED